MVRNAFLVFLAVTALAPSLQAIAPPDRVYQLDFDKLTCSICRKAIKDTLIGLDKVKSVDYDLKNYKCFVTMNGSATLSYDTVDKAFKGTKYVFRGISEKK
jgi:hypothetical protein